MAYEPKPNSGTLWPNDRKTAANHPDVRGDIYIDEGLLKDLMTKAQNGMVKVAISGWSKDINGKKVLSIASSAPYVKPAEDDGLPY
jgi:hypothetical protein